MNYRDLSKEWLNYAIKDPASARFLRKMKPLPREIICFHCQNLLLFWHDEEGKHRQCFDDYKNADVEKVELDNNEFAVKYRILKEGGATRFLVYSPSAKPADEDNWLLDLNLQHFIFATNQAAMIIQELEIDPLFEPVVNDHLEFFSK